MSIQKFMLSCVEHVIVFITSGPVLIYDILVTLFSHKLYKAMLVSVFDFNVHVVDIMQFDLKLGPEY